VALAELVTLMPDHGWHDTWFEDAARTTDKEQRQKHPQEWWLDPTLTALSALAVNAAHHSSAELLLAIVDALDLPQRIKSWTTPESRLATLDALCQIAGGVRGRGAPDTDAGVARRTARSSQGSGHSVRADLGSRRRAGDDHAPVQRAAVAGRGRRDPDR
jgi:hypothetical protein